MSSVNSMINDLKNYGIKDKKILNTFKKIKRHYFVQKRYKDYAYSDQPLPIPKNQTISQPYTVAFMTKNLELKKELKVLEIGTGSGYSSSIIAELIKPSRVYTTEYHKELVEFAKKNIKKAKIKNIKVVHKDGSKGYKKESPYDRIIFTCSNKRIPKPLISQLKNNGIILGPIGNRFHQNLIKIKKINNKLKKQNLGGFIFVPMLGKYGVNI